MTGSRSGRQRRPGFASVFEACFVGEVRRLPRSTDSAHSVDAAGRRRFECVAVFIARGTLRMRDFDIDLEPPRGGGYFDGDGALAVCTEHMCALAVGE